MRQAGWGPEFPWRAPASPPLDCWTVGPTERPLPHHGRTSGRCMRTGCCWVCRSLWSRTALGRTLCSAAWKVWGPSRTRASWGRWGRSPTRASWGSQSLCGWGQGLGMRLAALCPCWAFSHPDGEWAGRGWAASHSLPCVPGGSWITLASDVFDCCYLTGKLSGGAYTFRTAQASKAAGPHSSPRSRSFLGGPSRLGEPLGRPLWECACHLHRSHTHLG